MTLSKFQHELLTAPLVSSFTEAHEISNLVHETPEFRKDI